ncbi:MAG: SH3 domain-containing protein [bacterium]
MTSELQNLFNEAVLAQSQGNNTLALAKYSAVRKQGFTSSSIELNEALIFESKEEYGKALARISKAQNMERSPWLAFEVQERIQRKVSSNRAYSIGSFGEMMEESSKVLRPSEGFLVGLTLLGCFFVKRGIGYKNRIDLPILFVTSFFILFALFASFSNSTAYVLSDTELKSVPVEGSAPKMNLLRGSKVSVLQEGEQFVEVERPGDFKGWVSKDSLFEN